MGTAVALVFIAALIVGSLKKRPRIFSGRSGTRFLVFSSLAAMVFFSFS